MRRIFIFLLSVTMVAIAAYSQQNQMELLGFKEIRSAGGLDNLSSLFKEDWPLDDNGKPCSWVRVKFENMTLEEAEKVSFNFGTESIIAQDDPKQVYKDLHERWIFVGAAEKTYIEAQHPKYGTTDRLEIKMIQKGVYDVLLKNNKTVSVTVDTKRDGADVYLVELGMKKKSAPKAVFEDIPMGNYTLVVSYNGSEKHRSQISVTETNIFFEADAREKKTLTITSDPTGATVYVDNVKQPGKTPLKVNLPYGSHTFRAELGYGEVDEQSFNINDATGSTINLEPIEKQEFEAVAMYNGRKVNADLYIDNELQGQESSSYTLKLPTGKTYSMRMTYAGNKKEKKVTVTKGMGEQVFKIPTRKTVVWPWDREYEAAPIGFSLGYVQKQLVTQGEGERYKENGIWSDGEGKWLHGFQIGLHFQPCFKFGLGLYTGLFYELYISSCEDEDVYTNFMEHDIYVPAHVLFRLPFANKSSLVVHGGLGFNYAVYGAFSDEDDEYEDYSDFYGEDAYPKRFNMAAEIGIGLRIGSVKIDAQYSKGINNHGSYEYLGNYKTKQNKYSFSVSYLFSVY